VGSIDKAILYARKAGDRAMAQVAWDEAAGQYERAIQLLELNEPVDRTQLCDALLALGDAELYAGPSSGSDEACAAYRRAADVARELGLPEKFARAALGIAGYE